MKSNARLLKLIEFMERLKLNGNKFDMTVIRKDRECGTTACAMGWATTIPEFAKAGFKVDPVEDCTVFREFTYQEAAMQFFGIDSETYTRLFFNHNDPVKTPKQWAKRARRILGVTK